MVNDPWTLAAVPLLILLNAFFVASEYAVVATRPVHLAMMRRRGRTAAADAMDRLKARSANTIGAIQVCITVTNLVLGWLGEPAMTRLLHAAVGPLVELLPASAVRPISVALSFLVVTLLTVVFSELLPKAMTLRHVQTVTSLTAVPMYWIGRVVAPLVWLMNGLANMVTRPLGLGRIEAFDEEQISIEELRLMAAEAAKAGVLTAREQTLIVNALSTAHRIARQMMVPRVQVAYVDLQNSMDENRRVMNQYLYSRFPLCNGGLDHVIGVVHTKRFLTAYHAAGDSSVLSLIADKAVFAPEIANTSQLLATFHDRKTEFLLLVDEYGGLAGILTLKDVVDDLMGLVDESKALVKEALRGDLESSGRLKMAGRVVRGDLAVHELARLLELDGWASTCGAATVGGLVQHELGRVGQPGEEVVVEGVKLKVVRSDARAVHRVEVSLDGDAVATARLRQAGSR